MKSIENNFRVMVSSSEFLGASGAEFPEMERSVAADLTQEREKEEISMKKHLRNFVAGLALLLLVAALATPALGQFNNGIPLSWTVSSPTDLAGTATSTSGLTPSAGTAFAWISNGCTYGYLGGDDDEDETCPDVATATASYGSLLLPDNPAGLGSPTVQTTLTSPSFVFSSSGTISFDVDFITTDGTVNFADYAVVYLVPAAAGVPSIPLYVANTTCAAGPGVVCYDVPPTGLTPGQGTLTPATASFLGTEITLTNASGSTVYGPYSYSGGNGGDSGWIHVTYPVSAGTYQLQFVVANVGDTEYPSALAIDNVTQTLTVTLTGLGAGSVADTTNSLGSQTTPISCNLPGVGAAQTGTCSEIDPTGDVVTLTETPGATAAGASTFGGWTGACASFGTSSTCTVTMSSSQNVGASFIAPPITQPVGTSTTYCTSGSPNTASTQFCPANTYNAAGVCTDPNGVIFSIEIPVLQNVPSGSCISLQATATEAAPTGICPQGQVADNGLGYPNGPTTSFGCRFVDYYNYGTDASGDVVTPYCYGYDNGDCVFYHLEVVDSNNNEPLTPSQTPAGVLWSVNINPTNALVATPFTVPPGYASTPRVLDDPDEDEVMPTSMPWLTNCSTPMNMEASSSTGVPDPLSMTGYSTPVVPNIYCQFDNDITTFFYGSVGGDPPKAGGKSDGSNDIVLAFLPTATTGSGSPSPNLPSPVAPTVSLNCDVGCTPNGSYPNPTPVSSGGNITFTEGTAGTAVVTETGYPTPSLTIGNATTTSVSAMELGNIVTLTIASGTFVPQFVLGASIVVDDCTLYPAYQGSFLIGGVVGSPATALTYTDSATGLGNDSCMVTVLPAGLTFDLGTGVLGGTPGVGSAGSYPGTTFTATNSVSAASQSYNLIVNPATPTVNVPPTATSLTYGQTLASSTLSGGSALVNGSVVTGYFTFTYPTTVPPVGTTPESVTFTPYDPTDYTTATGTASVTVIAATPTVIWPTASSLIYGQTLASSTLSGGSATANGNAVPGKFAWTYPTTVPPVGTTSESVTFTPTNTTDYNTVTGAVNVTVPNPLVASVASVTIGKPTAPFYPGQKGLIPAIFTVTNTGVVSISVSNITINGINSNDFGDLGWCFTKMPGTLPPAGVCLIGVDAWNVVAPPVISYSPYVATANLVIDPAAVPAITIPMTTYVINPVASFSASGLSSGKLTFPITPKGSKNTVTITVANTGTTPLIFANPAISSVSAPFSATTGCSGETVQANGTCTISVTFAPTATGTFTQTLKITDNANGSSQSITLSGTT